MSLVSERAKSHSKRRWCLGESQTTCVLKINSIPYKNSNACSVISTNGQCDQISTHCFISTLRQPAPLASSHKRARGRQNNTHSCSLTLVDGRPYTFCIPRPQCGLALGRELEIEHRNGKECQCIPGPRPCRGAQRE